MKHLIAGALLALGTPFLAAAACPAGTTPSTFLLNQKYAFRLNNPLISSKGLIGTFVVGPNGILTAVDTVNSGTTISRLAQGGGRLNVNVDCSGGIIVLVVNYTTVFLDFTTSGTGATLSLTWGGDDALTPAQQALPNPDRLQGIARQIPMTMGCPASTGGNPLNVLLDSGNATTWGFLLNGPFTLESGSFTLYPTGGFSTVSGPLLVNRTIVSLPPPSTTLFNGMDGQGRYLVEPDCSGGEILFNTNGYMHQMEYVFSSADFKEIYLVEDDGNALVVGTASR